MIEKTHNTSAIDEEISNIAIELYDAISKFHENDDAEAVQKYIESYIKRVTRIGFRVGKSEFTALRDFCVIFHDILEDLNKQKVELTESQFQQFEVWPTLILAYMNDPTDNNNINLLMDFIEDPAWNFHADEGEFKELRKEFLNTNIDNQIDVTESPAPDTTITPSSKVSDNVDKNISSVDDDIVGIIRPWM